MNFDGTAILLDIEGTTSSVSFVYDVMFPYVRRELSAFLQSHWEELDVRLASDQIAHDAGQSSLEDWVGADPTQQRKCVEQEIVRLMDADVKATGLKQLQGLVWRDGFQSGEMKAHVYEEVPSCIQYWREQGIDVRIYSSGSVQAQHLFFAHTSVGNLLSLFSGHYDTNIGSKKETTSYQRILTDWNKPPNEVLFLSDVVAELDAARDAGIQTSLCKRPGNAVVEAGHGHTEIEDFEAVLLKSASD